MSMKALRKALKNKVTDKFEIGTVVRWTSSEKFVYTAVKSPVGWFTSAAEYNRYVPQIVNFEELVEILSRAETSNIEVATVNFEELVEILSRAETSNIEVATAWEPIS